jgi:hypothetical protein
MPHWKVCRLKRWLKKRKIALGQSRQNILFEMEERWKASALSSFEGKSTRDLSQSSAPGAAYVPS